MGPLPALVVAFPALLMAAPPALRAGAEGVAGGTLLAAGTKVLHATLLSRSKEAKPPRPLTRKESALLRQAVYSGLATRVEREDRRAFHVVVALEMLILELHKAKRIATIEALLALIKGVGRKTRSPRPHS
jgi:hypothetical protein